MLSHECYNERQLLLQVSQGDEIAFATLFTTHQHKLGEYIFRLSGNYELTQEIVQDIFLKIWRRREELSEIDHFPAYLFVISRNHAFNCLKQVAIERERKQTWLKDNKEAVCAERETDHSYQRYYALMEATIEKLPPRQKAVYLLSHRERLSYEEIAGRLHLSFETVKKHKSLALQFIRKQVNAKKSSILLTFLFLRFFC